MQPASPSSSTPSSSLRAGDKGADARAAAVNVAVTFRSGSKLWRHHSPGVELSAPHPGV